MIVNNSPLGVNKEKKPPVFSYTGTYELKVGDPKEDGTVDWELALKTSGVLTFSRVVDKVDIFAVGGGAPGANGSVSWNGYPKAVGGAGGKGGGRQTVRGKPVTPGTEYSVTIGASGTATTCAGLGISAASGAGSKGATGASQSYNPTNVSTGTPADNGEYAFGESSSLFASGRRYGAGGAGGNARAESIGYESTGGSAGSTGGGTRGTKSSRNGKAGADNTGAGGGGAYAIATGNDYDYGFGGAGGTGIMIIRNARATS